MTDFARDRIRAMVQEVLVELSFRLKPGASRERRNPVLPTEGPRTLIVFNAGVRKLEQAIDQVRQIQEAHGRVSVFTGPSAREWVCGADVKEQAGGACILDTVKPEGLERALSHADILVLPTLCFGVAAKVARLMRDDLEARLVMSALLEGKNIVAARDGFSILDNRANKAVQGEIESTLDKLENFGFIFSETAQLYTTFQKVAARIGKGISQGAAPEGIQLVTAKHVMECQQKGEKTIRLAAKGKVTSLAVDLAKEHGIEVIRSRP
jgi:ethanolamine utilization protein